MAEIKTIGVCGAGVMGSQLAAFFAGAGFDALLFDLKQELSEKGIEARTQEPARRPSTTSGSPSASRPATTTSTPTASASATGSSRRSPSVSTGRQGLYDEDPAATEAGRRAFLQHLGSAPARSWPRDSTKRSAPLLDHPLLQSAALHAPGGDHPRRAARPDDVLEAMVEFVGETLGKGVVYAKDTPNFIANRIGIYGMMLALKLTGEMQLTVEQVDALTGPVMGRPKSATYRTADLVGLDTLALVAKTSYDKCTGDEDRDMFQDSAACCEGLLESKSLGQKTGAGFYKKEGKQILALDFESHGVPAEQQAAHGRHRRGAALHGPAEEDPRPGAQPGPRRRVRLGADHRHAGLCGAAPRRDRRRHRQRGQRDEVGLRLATRAVRDLGRHRRREVRACEWSARARRCRSWCEAMLDERPSEFLRSQRRRAASISSTWQRGSAEPVPVPEGQIVLADRKARGRRDPAQLERFAGGHRRRRGMRGVPLRSAAGVQPDRRRRSWICCSSRLQQAAERGA